MRRLLVVAVPSLLSFGALCNAASAARSCVVADRPAGDAPVQILAQTHGRIDPDKGKLVPERLLVEMPSLLSGDCTVARVRDGVAFSASNVQPDARINASEFFGMLQRSHGEAFRVKEGEWKVYARYQPAPHAPLPDARVAFNGLGPTIGGRMTDAVAQTHAPLLRVQLQRPAPQADTIPRPPW